MIIVMLYEKIEDIIDHHHNLDDDTTQVATAGEFFTKFIENYEVTKLMNELDL